MRAVDTVSKSLTQISFCNRIYRKLLFANGNRNTVSKDVTSKLIGHTNYFYHRSYYSSSPLRIKFFKYKKKINKYILDEYHEHGQYIGLWDDCNRLGPIILFSADTAHLIVSPKQYNLIRCTISADLKMVARNRPLHRLIDFIPLSRVKHMIPKTKIFNVT